MNDDANKNDSFFVDTSIIIDESKNNNNNKQQLLLSNDSSIDENKIDSLANDIFSDLIDDVLFGLMNNLIFMMTMTFWVYLVI